MTKIKIRSLPLALAVLAAFLALTQAYILKDLVDEAEAELNSEILGQLERGGTSHRFIRKKVTPE